MEQNWNRIGTGMERKPNGNGTKIQGMDNGSSIKGSQLVYNRITGWAP